MDRPTHEAIWNECLRIIGDNVSAQSYSTWFKPIKALSLVDSTLTIEVPSDFFREYLEEHFLDILKRTLYRIIGSSARLIYSVRIISTEKNSVVPPRENHNLKNNATIMPPITQGVYNPFAIPGIQTIKIDPNLDPKNSFSNFIEGDCNKLGRSAGLAIAEKPGTSAFNPLFLYGGSGLGKTHLAQAIGIEIKDKYPEKTVLYVSANKFQIQYMDAVHKDNKLTNFLHFYQTIDVLIIDDVHEFAGKEGTQNTFFHIFNQLYQSGKQVILTSDRPPVELTGLEKRLLSRFKWGLSAELQQPDFETRVAILKAKSFKEGIELPEEVIDYLANTVRNNVREIEGTFVSLLAHALLTNKSIDINLAKHLTEKIVNTNNANDITIPKIQNIVCNYFGIPADTLLSKTRKREIVQARQIAMYLSRNHTKSSLASIGSEIGGKDHATVLHACSTVSDLMDTDNTFRQYVNDIEKQLLNSSY